MLYNHAKTAGYVYQARLREEVTKRLGLHFGEVTNGYADLLAVPEQMQRQYSTRRQQIVDALHKANRWGAKAAQAAAFATRYG